MPTYPKISDDPAVQQHYESMRSKGESHNMAEMCAMRQASGTRGSERAIMFDVQNHGMNGWPEAMKQHRLQQAVKAGINPTGKVYMPNLGRHGVSNDPNCWVSDTGDVIRALKARGDGCEQLGVKPATYMPRKPAVRLSEKLIKEKVLDRMHGLTPAEARKIDRKKLREEIIEKHGAKKVVD